MMPIRFPSVLNPDKFGYEWTNDSMTFWDTAWNSGRILHMSAGSYETYGDGGCQHTPLVACSYRQTTDYCLSLARFLLANPTVEARIGHHLFEPLLRDGVLFLAGVVYREDKRQWFNLVERKVSSAESRQHDKRWFQVPSWADGTVASAVGLFNLTRPNERHLEVLETLALHEYFLGVLGSIANRGEGWEKITAYQTEIPGDFTAAFRALHYVVKSREDASTALRMAECCEHNSRLANEQVA